MGVILLIILFLFCPFFIVDILVASRVKKAEPKQQIDIKPAGLDLEHKLKKDDLKKEELQKSSEKHCKLCGKKIDIDAKICTYCGSEV